MRLRIKGYKEIYVSNWSEALKKLTETSRIESDSVTMQHPLPKSTKWDVVYTFRNKLDYEIIAELLNDNDNDNGSTIDEFGNQKLLQKMTTFDDDDSYFREHYGK